MGRLNLRFVAAGLVAGVVINVGDGILYGVLLAPEFTATMERLGLAAPGGGALILYPLMAFATGYVALWLYAMARAGLGAGPRTAVKTALAVWMLLYVIPSVDLVMEGIWSRQAFWTAAAVGLVTLAAATLAGARVYRPKAEAPTRSHPITAG